MPIRTYRELYPDPYQWDDPTWFERCADLSKGYDERETNWCQVTNYGQHYICTRPANHEGPHIADDGCSVVAVWE